MKSLLKRSPLFAFNLVFRDRWVAAQAATLPAGGARTRHRCRVLPLPFPVRALRLPDPGFHRLAG